MTFTARDLARRLGVMDSDELASMYAEIVRGTTKARSRFAGRSVEAGRLWDRIAAEVAATRAEHPGAAFDIPNEVPASV